MAKLCAGNGYTILSFNNASIVFELTDGTCKETFLEHVDSGVKEQSDNSDPSLQEQFDISDISLSICSALSHTSEYFTICVHKELLLWNTKNWNLISKRQVNRSPSAITFSPKDDRIVVADKSGDVYLFSVESPDTQGELILGHVSMLLDILITPNNKYVITCDRDEKIRVSFYPNAYNIQSYCLGHEEFVTCLTVLSSNENILVSGSGDGTCRFWDYKCGKQLLCYSCAENNVSLNGNKPIISKIVSHRHDENTSLLCVQLMKVNGVLLYNIGYNVNKNEIFCKFKNLISMDIEPLSLCVNGIFLYALKPNVNDCFSVYRYCKDKSEFIVDYKLSSLLKNNLKKYNFLLENAFKIETQIDTLYKRRFDNLQEYLKRKMDRIQTRCKKHLSSSQIT